MQRMMMYKEIVGMSVSLKPRKRGAMILLFRLHPLCGTIFSNTEQVAMLIVSWYLPEQKLQHRYWHTWFSKFNPASESAKSMDSIFPLLSFFQRSCKASTCLDLKVVENPSLVSLLTPRLTRVWKYDRNGRRMLECGGTFVR